MRFYQENKRILSPGELKENLAQMVQELIPDANPAVFCLFNRQSPDQMIFSCESTSEILWVRIFHESLQHASAALLNEEKHEIDSLVKQHMEGRQIKALVLYPGLVRGIEEILKCYPEHWQFWQYSFVQNADSEALVVRNLAVTPDERKWEDQKNEIVEAHTQNTSYDIHQHMALSTHELNELIELSLDLKS